MTGILNLGKYDVCGVDILCRMGTIMMLYQYNVHFFIYKGLYFMVIYVVNLHRFIIS